jgi:hypothetical protein
MHMRLVHLWSARAQHAVIRRMRSSTLPQRAAYCSDDTTLSYRSWPPLWPRGAVFALLKTRNQLIDSPADAERKSGTGLPAYPPCEGDRLVGSAWRVGSLVPRWPMARLSDPLYIFRSWYSVAIFAPSSAHGICAHYRINLLFCQALFPDSL